MVAVARHLGAIGRNGNPQGLCGSARHDSDFLSLDRQHDVVAVLKNRRRRGTDLLGEAGAVVAFTAALGIHLGVKVIGAGTVFRQFELGAQDHGLTGQEIGAQAAGNRVFGKRAGGVRGPDQDIVLVAKGVVGGEMDLGAIGDGAVEQGVVTGLKGADDAVPPGHVETDHVAAFIGAGGVVETLDGEVGQAGDGDGGVHVAGGATADDAERVGAGGERGRDGQIEPAGGPVGRAAGRGYLITESE